MLFDDRAWDSRNTEISPNDVIENMMHSEFPWCFFVHHGVEVLRTEDALWTFVNDTQI